MDIGVCVASKVDDIDHIVLAEELGFAAAWCADSQMLWSDVYATLALAAVRTSTIRLGTGVAVAATRPAPVTAASIGTIARLAPGRSFLAIATLHYADDNWRNYGKEPTNPAVLEVWDDYVAMLALVPEERRHQVIHRGHNCWVDPEEKRFVTKGLIETSCMVGTADDLIERLRTLDDAGLDEVIVLPPLATRDEVLRSIAADVLPAL